MQNKDTDHNPAIGSFEETRQWQLFEFSKLSTEEKINFLGDMFEVMKSIKLSQMENS